MYAYMTKIQKRFFEAFENGGENPRSPLTMKYYDIIKNHAHCTAWQQDALITKISTFSILKQKLYTWL
jgi:hypothetical protein